MMKLQNPQLPSPFQAPEPELDRFDVISLEDLKNSDASLLSRKERKFLMTRDQFTDLLSGLDDSYRVLEVENAVLSGYSTEYYDTDSFLTYLQHHNGKATRHKLRVRHYQSSDETYLEVKEKRNTGQTVKTRIRMDEYDGPRMTEEPDVEAFLASDFPYDFRDFHPVLTTDYTRVTLVSRDHPERMTFDLGLRFQTDSRSYAFPEVVVGEIKHNCPLRESPAGAALREMGIRDTSFSKYCMGVSLIYCGMKHNRFKPNMLLLEKLSAQGAAVC
jgi:hypothetical protein